MIFLIEALDRLGQNGIKQIIEKTLITKIDKNLFPDSELKFDQDLQESYIISESANQEISEENNQYNLNKRVKLII